MNERHGLSHTPAWRSWKCMRERCYKEHSPSYKWYGAKGIRVCPQWNFSFLNFLEDMGERPEGTTLDRINSKKGYMPSNCRWATAKEQNNNRTNNFKYKGLSLTEWCIKLDLIRATVATRLDRGWPWDEALELKKRGKR